MRTTSSFDSDLSFEGLGSLETSDNAVSDTVDWGIVSHSDASDEDNGVLILNGEDEADKKSGISFPGTDSLPTDIGTLSENNEMMLSDTSLGAKRTFSHRTIRYVFFSMVALLSVAGIGLTVLKWNKMCALLIELEEERNSLRTLVVELEEKMRRLEPEKVELRASLTQLMSQKHSLKTSILELEEKIWLLEEENTGFLESLSDLESENDSLSTSVLELKEKLELFEGEKAGLRKSVFELESERHSLQTMVLEQGERIRLLEAEKVDLPPWMDGQQDDGSYLLILDNCWVTAKVKFGKCSERASEIPLSFVDSMKKISGLHQESSTPKEETNCEETNHEETNREEVTCEETNPKEATCEETNREEVTCEETNHEETNPEEATCEETNHEETNREEKQGKETNREGTSHDFEDMVRLAFPWLFSGGAGSLLHAPDSLSQTLNAAGEAMVSDLSQASESLAQVINAAGEAMFSEVRDLSNDPLGYVKAAYQGATLGSKKEKITLKGLTEIAKAVSEVSLALGKDFAQKNKKTLKMKMAEIMDDPLSFFDFKTKSK